MARKKPDPEKEAAIADELLIREVDEDLRAEKLQNWWQKFGSLLVGSCVTIVVATIAYQIATSYRTGKAEERTAVLLEAISLADKGQTQTALTKLSPLAEDSSSAGALAGLQAAYLKQQDAQDTKAFEPLAEQDEQPVIADLAKIQTQKLDDVPEESAFYPLATEQKAIDFINKGQKPEARKLLLSLLDRNDLPNSQRQRLNELLQGVN